MRTNVIVLADPLVDHSLGLSDRSEPFGVEDLAAQGAVEPFVVTILPRRARIYVYWLDSDTFQPFSLRSGCELRAVV